MLFSDISTLCYHLETENSRIKKKYILINFFQTHSIQDIKQAINFLSLSIDNTIAIFQINEITLIKYIGEYFNIDRETIKQHIKTTGDIGLYIKELDNQANNKSDILFSDINNLLIELKNINGKDSQEEKKIKLSYIFSLLNNFDICYVTRFILGSLRIGLSEKTIIEALHDMLSLNNILIKKEILFRAYATCSHIAYIAELTLSNNREAILKISPQIGIFIQPQAAEIYIKDKKPLSLDKTEYIWQPKIDGFRLQIHIQNNTVYLFSRNGILVNHMFPEIIDASLIFKESNKIENAILDGEIIGYDDHSDSFLSFEKIAQRKRKHNIINNNQLSKTKLILFDILFFNHDSFLEMPYKKRLNKIDNFIYNSQIGVISSQKIYNEWDIEKAYQTSIELKQEGIMIKDLYSYYEPGKRSKNWLKYKHIQKDSIEDLIDAVILGFTIAKGARKTRQQIGSLLVGIYNEEGDCFETLAQVGTGGDTSLWHEIETMITPLICQSIPSGVKINKKYIPDYFIEPRIIISLKADKVTASREHSSGYSIRFPRIISIRKDKNKYQTHCPLS